VNSRNANKSSTFQISNEFYDPTLWQISDDAAASDAHFPTIRFRQSSLTGNTKLISLQLQCAAKGTASDILNPSPPIPASKIHVSPELYDSQVDSRSDWYLGHSGIVAETNELRHSFWSFRSKWQSISLRLRVSPAHANSPDRTDGSSLLISHPSQSLAFNLSLSFVVSINDETPALDSVRGGRTASLATLLGILIGAIAFLLLIAILVILLVRRHRSKEEQSELDYDIENEFKEEDFGTLDDDEDSLSFGFTGENYLEPDSNSLLNGDFLSGGLEESLDF
jgi:hypothetical protein